jgi:hypothetical protein
MKTVVGVIAALVTVGLAALGLLTAQRLSPSLDHVAFRDQDTAATTRPSVSTIPSVSAAAPVASSPAQPAPPSVASEHASQSNAQSGLTGETTTNSLGAPGAIAPCEKPDVMGVSRVVEIGTAGGPEFGLQHLSGHDFLGDKEVVLTFDDGPRPVNASQKKHVHVRAGRHRNTHTQKTIIARSADSGPAGERLPRSRRFGRVKASELLVVRLSGERNANC